jgi:hypothetical protein
VVLEAEKNLAAIVEAVESSRWPQSASNAVLLLSIYALKGVGNVITANFNAGTGILLRRAIREDGVEPTLADLGVATELFDEGRVFLSSIVNYLDQFG